LKKKKHRTYGVLNQLLRLLFLQRYYSIKKAKMFQYAMPLLFNDSMM